MYTVARLVEDTRRIAHDATGKYFLDLAVQAAEETLADLFSQNWNFNTGEGAITTVAPYTTGTIAAVNGSQSITGTGTTWLTSWPVPAVLRPSGSSGEPFLVTAIGSGTGLTIDRPWPFDSASGQTYVLEFPSYTIPEYIRIQEVCLPQFPWSYPLQLSSMESILYNRTWWTARALPCEFFVIAGDGTTSASLVLNPAPEAVQTVRFRYTKAVPSFRCLNGLGNSVELGGVATLAAGGTAVTGSSTSWLKLGYSLVGHYFESPDQDGIYSLISAVGSDTGMTVAAWGGRALTTASYSVSPQILVPDDMRPMLRDLMRWKYFQNAMEPKLAAEAQARYERNKSRAKTRVNRMRGPGNVQPIDLGMSDGCAEPGRPWNLVMTYDPP